MSWCRWGSACTNTIENMLLKSGFFEGREDTVGEKIAKDNEECENCPGSDLYIYEDVMGGFTCCGCPSQADGESVNVATEKEMYEHILEHDKAGHHVRKSLLAAAREELKK